MGLFDFALEYGKKLFETDADAAENIHSHLKREGMDIANLKVEFDDGTVSLSGNADSADTKEKAVLLAGNVQGVKEVDADKLEAPQQTDKMDFYIIKKGDTLSGLAMKYYGNAKDYPRIFEANREVIRDPNLIYVGQKIRIPLQ